MLKIQEPQVEVSTGKWFEHPFLQLAFRSHFILASIVALASIVVWLAVLNGYWAIRFTGINSIVWHVHEMLFGFAATVAVGFISTAVKTWTGLPSLTAKPLAALIAVWLLVRVCLWLNMPALAVAGMVLQAIWWAAVIICYSKIVFAAANRRNYLFIPLLTALAAVNMSLLYFAIQGDTATALHLARSGVLLFTLVMGIVGGRVIPFFTVRGAGTKAINTPVTLQVLLTITSLMGICLFIVSGFVNLPFSPAGFLLAAGLLHLTRLSFWRGTETLRVPLLWSLHLSYGFVGLGLMLLGASYWFDAITFSGALHLITLGAMGLMIIAMMSRVSLGHTGRPLQVHTIVPWIFTLVIITAVTRFVLPALGLPLLGWNLSGLLWVMACALFLVIYLPILVKPRLS